MSALDEKADRKPGGLLDVRLMAAEALEPFANAAREFSFSIGPDGIDDGVTLTLRAPNGRECFLSSADLHRAAAVFASLKAGGRQ